MRLPPDIEQYVLRKFASSEQAQAMALVAAAVIHDGLPAGPRLMRCALVSSGGNLPGLRRQLDQLKIDYRDVIVEGEYVPRGGRLVRVRSLVEPFAEES